MSEAYIVSAARTVAVKRGGKLANWQPIDLDGKLLSEFGPQAMYTGSGLANATLSHRR
jgi:hypothetical protein